VTEINEAPTAKITGVPVVSKKDTAISLTGEFNNLDAGDTHSYSWTVTKDGAVVTSSTEAGPVSYTPAQTGSYLVTLKVEDDHGGIGTDAVTIVVVEPGIVTGLDDVKRIVGPAAESGFIGTVSSQWVTAESCGACVTNGKYGAAWVVDSFAKLTEVTKNRDFGVLELNGHGGVDGHITWGASGTTVASTSVDATAFGQTLKSQVLGDKPAGVLILHFCLTGTFTRQDSTGTAKSLPQIVANMTGWTVISAGGFASGQFANVYEPLDGYHDPTTHKVIGRLPSPNDTNFDLDPNLEANGLAYESADNIWYLSTPSTATD
jgi:hypothetical protein